MRIAVFCFLLALQASALKFLAYNPRIGTSHFTFVSSVVEALVDAGHEVVMLAPPLTDKVKIVETNGARVITDFVVSERGKELADRAMLRATDLFWTYKSDLDFAEILHLINSAAAAQCNATLHTPGLIERLKEEKFDAAFGEPIDLCGMGIFHLAGIKTTAIVFSVSTTEATFAITGAPTTPATCQRAMIGKQLIIKCSDLLGSMADFGERMTFPQRVLNTLTLGALYHVVGSIRDLFQEVFDPLYPIMPTFYDILLNASMIFPNCDPITDFPRPTSHKIVEIGGITVAAGKDGLDEKWSGILALRPMTVLLSFGSAAQANRMPDAYKKAIRGMVASLPEDARLSAFITHGGAGSTTEATHSGVPLIVVPLMGDQLRNSHLIERLGTGIRFPKESLTSASELTAAVKRIIEDKSFKEKAALVASQLREAPFSPREKLVRNMEFMAKYGPLTMLDHYGPQLYTFQYYLIDVFAFLFVVLVAIIGLVFVCIRCSLRRVFARCTGKAKNE